MTTKLTLPTTIDDGRLDSILGLLQKSREHLKRADTVELNWQRTVEISPAGFAILACIFDALKEQNIAIKNDNVPSSLKENVVVKNLLRFNQFDALPSPTIHNFEDAKTILRGNTSSIDLFFMERVKDKFSSHLSENLEFAIRLICNELMQNSADHSTSERYYLYAGLWKSEMHVGVLDMGVTIPAKLSQKYNCADDLEYLKLAMQKGIGTRREREGGLGLYYFHDFLKDQNGKLTILSRNAQLRHYFATRKTQKNLLKHPLLGTWCFARFPLREKRR